MPTHHQGTPEEEIALNMFIALSRGTESLFSRLHAFLEEHHLTTSQFGVLETLYHLGPLTSSQIAEKHLRSRNNLSIVIGNLERDGLIQKRSCPGDRRARYVELSPSGREKIEAAFPHFVKSLVSECSALNVDEQKELTRLMKRLGKASKATTG